MRNLNPFKKSRTAVLVASLVFLTGPLLRGALDGSALVEEALRNLNEETTTITSEAEMEQFKGDLQKRVASLSDAERVEFLHTLAKSTLLGERYEDVEEGGALLIGLLHWSGTSREDQARAFSRFLGTEAPEEGSVVKGLLGAIASASSPAEEMSAFRPALEEADDVVKVRLVDYLFMRNPAGATEWFAMNAELSESERSTVLAELDAVRFMINPPDHYPGLQAPRQLLSADEIAGKVDAWLGGDSWILRLVAKSYLTKYPNRQTPDLQMAMRDVTSPATLKLLPNDPLTSRTIKRGNSPSASLEPAGKPRTSDPVPVVGNDNESNVVRRSIWGGLIAVVIALLWWGIGKRK